MEELNEILQAKHTDNYEKTRERLIKLAEKYPHDSKVIINCAFIHDQLGLEKEAVPYYEKALELGLPDDLKREAFLGLGSTFRTLGEYEKSRETLKRGIEAFPHAREMKVFYAMTEYNLGNYKDSVSLLLKELGETTEDSGIKQYSRAILFYADCLDETW